MVSYGSQCLQLWWQHILNYIRTTFILGLELIKLSRHINGLQKHS